MARKGTKDLLKATKEGGGVGSGGGGGRNGNSGNSRNGNSGNGRNGSGSGRGNIPPGQFRKQMENRPPAAAPKRKKNICQGHAGDEKIAADN